MVAATQNHDVSLHLTTPYIAHLPSDNAKPSPLPLNLRAFVPLRETLPYSPPKISSVLGSRRIARALVSKESRSLETESSM